LGGKYEREGEKRKRGNCKRKGIKGKKRKWEEKA
jgi:hypothetical protein